MAKILGIDPGLASTGVGIVEGRRQSVTAYAFGSITTPKSQALVQRLATIFSKLQELLAEVQPDVMIVEDVFSLPENPKSGLTLGKVSGVILLAGFLAGIYTTEIPVREAKKVLTGNGRASKVQLEVAVRHLLNRPDAIRPFHASDALALALIGMFRFDAAHGPLSYGEQR
jgi:crossover junction endodeoxyribonuclease RuvC